jgi:YHS domain-containing protein
MKVTFLLFITFLSDVAIAQVEVRIKHFNIAKNSVAIEGYDPVAYFKEKKAVKGNEVFSVIVEGVKYYFSSQTTKDLFLKNEKQYEPQYGGWCAYAMGINGEKVGINPKTFKIVDNKLYLFYNANLTNTLKKWNKEEQALKTKADSAWITIFQ